MMTWPRSLRGTSWRQLAITGSNVEILPEGLRRFAEIEDKKFLQQEQGLNFAIFNI